jgi:hypothetical protein
MPPIIWIIILILAVLVGLAILKRLLVAAIWIGLAVVVVVVVANLLRGRDEQNRGGGDDDDDDGDVGRGGPGGRSPGRGVDDELDKLRREVWGKE